MKKLKIIFTLIVIIGLLCSCNKQISFSKRKYLPRFQKKKFIAKKTIKTYPETKKSQTFTSITKIDIPQQNLELIASTKNNTIALAKNSFKPIITKNIFENKKEKNSNKITPLDNDPEYVKEKSKLKIWQKILYILGMLYLWFLIPAFIYSIEKKATSRYKNSILMLVLILIISVIALLIAMFAGFYVLIGLSSFNFLGLFYVWAASMLILTALLLYLGIKTVLKN